MKEDHLPFWLNKTEPMPDTEAEVFPYEICRMDSYGKPQVEWIVHHADAVSAVKKWAQDRKEDNESFRHCAVKIRDGGWFFFTIDEDLTMTWASMGCK